MIKFILAGSPVLLSLLIFYSCHNAEGAKSTAAAPGQDSLNLIQRGAQLVAIMGCNDCHSPKKMGPNGPEPDPDRLLSGFPAANALPQMPNSSVSSNWVLSSLDLTAFAGPWGISFAANITSDPTGIGNWTLDRFVKALRQGQYNGIDGTRKILPPMPLQNFKNLSDEDLKAMFAYLQSTRSIKNVPPQPIPPGGKAI